jgi:protein tyrosine phosphatase (PTP) superfamily phosphohydrolase (DUF442 family)
MTSPVPQDLSELLPKSYCPLENVATGGQPAREQLTGLYQAGYRLLIDLRALDEPRGYDERAAAQEAGLLYQNLPVTPETLDDDVFGRFRALMRDPRNRPVVVHCGSGNRVGALLLPYLILDEGMTPPEAEKIARQVGLDSPVLRERALAYAETSRTQ